jgi:hypothetical protein
VNAAKSSFASYEERARLIHERILPGFANLRKTSL